MKKREFSKTLLIQESVLIWITTLFGLILSAYCIYNNYLGSLPWTSSIIVSAWAAYGVSQAMYYTKAKAENTTGGIKYESTLAEINKAKEAFSSVTSCDYNYTTTDNTDDYQI